jgi:outer membrane protein assembly factor BamB
MIEISCSCGGTFEVLNEQVARRVRCPRCGALASDLLAQAEQAGTGEETGQTEAPEPRFQISCSNHPDAQATQNCLNCGKPLCMACVRERGYFCSDECRDTVRANEPTMVTDTDRVSADDDKFERVITAIVAFSKVALLVAVVFGVGYTGYAIYQSKWGPRPQITSSMEVRCGPMFRTVVLDPPRVLVQAEDELSLVNLATKETLWKVDLHGLEEPYSPPKQSSSASKFSFDPSKFRDPLELVEVKGDNVVLCSERQLIAVNAQTGAVNWKFFEADRFLSHVMVTDDSVFGIVMGNYTSKAPPQSVAVCWALDDGSQRWSDANGRQYAASLVTPGNHLMTLAVEAPKTNAQDESEAELTASGLDVGAFRGAMFAKIQGAMASGSMDIDSTAADDESPPPGPTRNYVLQVHAVASGSTEGQSTVALAGTPHFEPLARHVCVVAGREVLAFADGPEPSWRATIPGVPLFLAEGGDVVAAATKDRIIALDANSGKLRWSRGGIRPQRLSVGPDGAVYAMLSYSRDEFAGSEAKTFRIEEISIGGTTDPRAPVVVLVRLDPKTGKTAWGVRNIGQELVFGRDAIFVFDYTVELRLLSNTGLNVGYHSIHCVSPKNGKELWTYLKAGDMHDHTIKDGKAFLVVTEGTPLGTPARPQYNYRLCMVERK